MLEGSLDVAKLEAKFGLNIWLKHKFIIIINIFGYLLQKQMYVLIYVYLMYTYLHWCTFNVKQCETYKTFIFSNILFPIKQKLKIVKRKCKQKINKNQNKVFIFWIEYKLRNVERFLKKNLKTKKKSVAWNVRRMFMQRFQKFNGFKLSKSRNLALKIIEIALRDHLITNQPTTQKWWNGLKMVKAKSWFKNYVECRTNQWGEVSQSPFEFLNDATDQPKNGH